MHQRYLFTVIISLSIALASGDDPKKGPAARANGPNDNKLSIRLYCDTKLKNFGEQKAETNPRNNGPLYEVDMKVSIGVEVRAILAMAKKQNPSIAEEFELYSFDQTVGTLQLQEPRMTIEGGNTNGTVKTLYLLKKELYLYCPNQFKGFSTSRMKHPELRSTELFSLNITDKAKPGEQTPLSALLAHIKAENKLWDDKTDWKFKIVDSPGILAEQYNTEPLQTLIQDKVRSLYLV